MRRVVSVSLGSSKRDKVHEATVLGEEFVIERRGTDGDMAKFKSLMEELDGQVDALTVGGADIWVVVGERKYAFREILDLVAGVKQTPVVDGSGLKHTLERETVRNLQHSGTIDFAQERAMLVSAVDRYGMAQALDAACPHVVYGDLMFGLGIPVPLRSYKAVETVGRLFLPIVTMLPFKWFYPTGEKQDRREPKFPAVFEDASVICGDFLYIRRYAPDRMTGKTIITNTVRKADLDWLRTTGLRQVVTTTPVMGGETFGTNVMEGVVVTLLGKSPDKVTTQDYLDVLKKLEWSPQVISLDAA
ncbi:MAG: hypothetical protein KF857_12355 [Fimbriimonadaceae bacterium]|nr:hypothetical protein [Fimbriimonadaceae bacterium]